MKWGFYLDLGGPGLLVRFSLLYPPPYRKKRSHQRCLDNACHCLGSNNMWLDGIGTMLSLLFPLAVETYPVNICSSGSIDCSEETYSRTTINGRPCSSFTIAAITHKVSDIDHIDTAWTKSYLATNQALEVQSVSRRAIFLMRGICGHTHSHFDG